MICLEQQELAVGWVGMWGLVEGGEGGFPRVSRGTIRDRLVLI